METSLLIGTAIVGLGALIVISILLKMILTGDYSLILNDRKDISLSSNRARTEPAQESRSSAPATTRTVAVFNLASIVAHFMHELPEWKTSEQRKKAAQDLAAIRERHSRESPKK